MTELSPDSNRVLTAADARIALGEQTYLEMFPPETITELGRSTI